MGFLKRLFQRIWKAVTIVAAVLLCIWVYLAFLARDPVFGPEQDVLLGEQTVEALSQEPIEYPVLSREEYPDAYAHIDRIVGNIVESSSIEFRDLFHYDQVRLIGRDDVMNAFCTPGGFIYVYTGLIKYLDKEDHLAGVLGHEIAHAERRHSSLRLQKKFGSERLMEFAILTSPISARSAIALAILSELTGLSYSRGQEAEADDWSVRYLADSPYACDGTAGFFEKLEAAGEMQSVPEFLSDHPDHAARVRDINALARALECSVEEVSSDQYQALKESLP